MPDESANEKIFDRSLRHAVFLQRYAAGLSNRTVEFFDKEVLPTILERVQRDLELAVTSAAMLRRKRLLETTRGILLEGVQTGYRKTVKELEGFATTEADWQVSVIRSSVPIRLQLELPSPDMLERAVSTNVFEGRNMRQWFGSIGTQAQAAIRRQINLGIVAGDSVSDISKRLTGTAHRGFSDGVFSFTRRNIDTIVRTALTDTASHARQATFDRNSEVIKGVMWVSTLDTRTSDICMGRDGEVFPIDSGPRPPAHMRCRSTVVPVLKSWKELGIDLDEVPEGTRASLNGQVPAHTTYGEWLKRQSREIQDEALGPTRAGLFRSGKVTIDRFVGRRGQTLTLAELRRRENLD